MQVVNKRTHKPTDHDIYISRPSPLGNPYIIGQHGTREEVIELYRHWLYKQLVSGNKAVIDALLAINDESNLVCWCHPQPCHGDVIVRAVRWLKSR